jgi:hypothetical protein
VTTDGNLINSHATLPVYTVNAGQTPLYTPLGDADFESGSFSLITTVYGKRRPHPGRLHLAVMRWGRRAGHRSFSHFFIRRSFAYRRSAFVHVQREEIETMKQKELSA